MLIPMREMAAQDRRVACVRAQDVSFAKEKGGKTWYRMMPSHWKQWRIFKAQDVKRKRKVSLAPIIGVGGI
jgi:hypothetical protein